MRWESWQPSRLSTGCLAARLVTELTCLDSSREVRAAQSMPVPPSCSALQIGAEKLQRFRGSPSTDSSYRVNISCLIVSQEHPLPTYSDVSLSLWQWRHSPGTHFTQLLCSFSSTTSPLWPRPKTSVTLKPLSLSWESTIKVLLWFTQDLTWNAVGLSFWLCTGPALF